MNLLTTGINFDSIPGFALILIVIIIAACLVLSAIDGIMSLIYFFKGNKSKLLSQDIAKVVMENNGLTTSTVRGGWFTIRFWNYSRKTKSLKLRKPFQYNRRNIYGMVTASCDAYNATLIENKDPKRWAVRFLGVFAPFIFVLGIIFAMAILVALSDNQVLAWTTSVVVFTLFTFFGSIMTVYGLIVLRKGVVEGFEKGVQQGRFHEGDLKTVRFWFKIKIMVAVATLILNTIEIILKIAQKANEKND